MDWFIHSLTDWLIDRFIHSLTVWFISSIFQDPMLEMPLSRTRSLLANINTSSDAAAYLPHIQVQAFLTFEIAHFHVIIFLVIHTKVTKLWFNVKLPHIQVHIFFTIKIAIFLCNYFSCYTHKSKQSSN